jgi:hypothetical protein
MPLDIRLDVARFYLHMGAASAGLRGDVNRSQVRWMDGKRHEGSVPAFVPAKDWI